MLNFILNYIILSSVDSRLEAQLKSFTITNIPKDHSFYSRECIYIEENSLPSEIHFQVDGLNKIIYERKYDYIDNNIISELNINDPIIYNSKNIQSTLTFNCNIDKNIINGIIIQNNNILEFSNDPSHPLMIESNNKDMIVIYNIANQLTQEADLLSSNDFLNREESDIRRLEVKKWNNCYRNDNIKHILNIGVAIGSSVFTNRFRTNLQNTINSLASIIAKTNLVYGTQLNINLKVSEIYISGRDGIPSWDNNKNCLNKRVNINSQLSSFKSWASQKNKKLGIWHLIDDCFKGSGVIGLAWVGTLCSSNGYNTGISWWSRRIWLTFAHEVGHNFGAQHSFEEGRGRTGGIMDYGNGLLNGEYQFNTKYRKNQVCRKVNSIINSCRAIYPINSPSKCITNGGAVSGMECIFPFTFRSVKYFGCTTITDPDNKLWCSTKVDDNGKHIRGNWGYCGEGCLL